MSESYPFDRGVTSVFEAAFLEARRHRWIESQKSRRDLGDTAFRDWYHRFWWPFLRYRHVEHLLGERQWEEFERNTFGVLQVPLSNGSPLNREIIELYRSGWENLDIINHAVRRDYPMNQIHDCLVTINMNDARLNPRFH